MNVKTSISLTDKQDAFARSLVKGWKYPCMSSVLHHGLELLRQQTEAETVETEALRQLLQCRLKQPVISATEMGIRVEALIERKRRSL